MPSPAEPGRALTRRAWPCHEATQATKNFRARHGMYCNCSDCNHEQPKTSEAEQKRLRSYLNGR